MEQTWTTLRAAPAARRRPRRSTYELAGLVSVLAVTVAYALHRFVGLGEVPIVLGTLVVASIVGWTQPALRAAPRRTGRLTPVIVATRRTGGPGRPA